MTVEQVVDGIIEREGREYTNRAADRGGPTKFGITWKTLGAWRRLGRPATPEEVQALEEPEAREIYRFKYIDEPNFDDLQDERLRVIVVDAGVLHGPVSAIKMLQRAVGVTADGVIGPRTIEAASAPTTCGNMVRQRVERCLDLVINTEAFQQFLRDHPKEDAHNLRGWIRRAVSFAE